MNENEYFVDDWFELHSLIQQMSIDIEERDYYELEGTELDIIKLVYEFVKLKMNIHTGKKIMTSPLTGRRYFVNIWVEEKGLITALSKRDVLPGDETE